MEEKLMVREIKRPVTAKQAQKLIEKTHGSLGSVGIMVMSFDDIQRVAEAIGFDTSHLGYFQRRGEVAKALDRFVAKYGGNIIILGSPESESKREHKIETDEVSPQSESPSEESDAHGGDSASGEVENGLDSKGGENQSGAGGSQAADQEGDSATGSGSGGTGESGQGPMRDGMPMSSQDRSGDAGQASDSCAETGNTTSAGHADDTSSQIDPKNALWDDGQRDETSSGEMSGTTALAETAGDVTNRQKSGAADNGEIDSLQPRDQRSADPGSEADEFTERTNSANAEDERPTGQAKELGDASGDTASEKYRYRKTRSSGRQSMAANKNGSEVTAKMSRAGITPSLVKEARATLARLIDGGESESGPRWDLVEFATRLQTFRPLQPARREEEGRPAILILADVSGSCAGFSDKSLMVAQAAAKIGTAGADVIAVSHVNGHPVEYQINGGKIEKIEQQSYNYQESISWYESKLKKFNIQAVIALGDWDAEWLYYHMSHKATVKRFLWLDNWASRALPSPVVRRDLFKKAEVNTAQDWSRPWQFAKPWSAAAQRKTSYVVGCGSASDFVAGINLALRSK